MDAINQNQVDKRKMLELVFFTNKFYLIQYHLQGLVELSSSAEF